MKYLASVSCLVMALGPAAAFAGGEVGPVIVEDREPVAVAPVAVGGVGGAPLEVATAGAIPLGAIAAAGLGALAVAGLILALDDDDDDGTTTTTTSTLP